MFRLQDQSYFIILSSCIRITHSAGEGASAAMSAAEEAIIRDAGMVTPAFRSRGRDPRYLSMQFTDGTPCDLDNINRATVVDVYCGPK